MQNKKSKYYQLKIIKMKRIILSLILVVGIITATSAQTSGKAIGARLTYGAELSYQQALSDINRIELDLGWAAHSLGVTGIYQWVMGFPGADGLNWYAGPGVGVGFYSGEGTNAINAGIVGQIGMEYNFDFPLQLSLDYRPGFYFVTGSNSFTPSYVGVALGVRYRF